jgi:hypothetical protein
VRILLINVPHPSIGRSSTKKIASRPEQRVRIRKAA